MSSPFDEAKYRALLDGLEITELSLEDAKIANYSFRLDNQFFQKEFLSIFEESMPFRYLSEICEIKSGTTPSDRDEELKHGVILLKTNDIRNNILPVHSDYFYIDRKTNQRMKSTELKANDVLVNIVGATTDVIGRCSIVPNEFPKANITQAMAFCRLIDMDFKPFYLFAFFTSKFANIQVRKIARPTGQYNMNLTELGTFKIPIVSIDFQNEIEKVILKAHEISETSKSIYRAAETILLTELCLQDFKPTEVNTSVRTIQDSFFNSWRLDAEYYQQKYDEMEVVCKKNAKYTKRIVEFRTFNRRGLQPDYSENGKLDVINSKHILASILDYGNFEKTEYLNWKSRAIARVNYGDILTYTTGANIGRTHTYLSNEPALASNHVNILRIENENSVYVAFVINSIVGQYQTEKLSAGSAQQELYPKDIDRFYIPFIKEEYQTKIEEKVIESRLKYLEGKRLIALAKTAVEIAIEENEEAALTLIKNNFEYTPSV